MFNIYEMITYLSKKSSNANLLKIENKVKIIFFVVLFKNLKFTYEGLATVALKSLNCVNVSGVSVWEFNGETKCLLFQKIIFIAFAVIYVLLFFSVLHFFHYWVLCMF